VVCRPTLNAGFSQYRLLQQARANKNLTDWLTRALLLVACRLEGMGLQVLVERAVHHHEFPEYTAFHPSENNGGVDFAITLGGDGTVLHLASLFERDEPLPPVVSFSMGTLGFLTPFDVTTYAETLSRVIGGSGPVFCTLRTRKRCEVFR
jgi:NAD+ kinase